MNPSWIHSEHAAVKMRYFLFSCKINNMRHCLIINSEATLCGWLLKPPVPAGWRAGLECEQTHPYTVLTSPLLW